MKTNFTIAAFLVLISLSNISKAQVVFWAEDFGSTCRFRGHADTYVGPNGAWTMTSTGQNDSCGNTWFINDRSTFNGVGNCASGNDVACATNPNNTLHIGGMTMPQVYISGLPIYPGAPEDSASYWTGYFAQFDSAYGATTNKRVESPVINCTGKTNISLSFNYYEGGDIAGGPNGDASLWYYDGTTWSLLDPLSKTTHGGCGVGILGVWTTSSSYNLPASANNNPNVKIGFNWANDNLSGGNDPSFAVDNIMVSASGSLIPPIAHLNSSDTVFCGNKCINFTDYSTNIPTSWLWTFTGATPSSSTSKNPQNICYTGGGSFNVKLVVSNGAGSDSVTFINFVTVHAVTPPVITPSTGGPSFCFGNSMDLYSSAASSYHWTGGATTQSITVSTAGTYVVIVTDANNCIASDSITITGLSPAGPTPICMVTTDSFSINNIVIWTKTHPSPIDSFIVYREITTNNYQPIGAVPNIGALSEFIDTTRTKYFPNTGSPNEGSYRYKLQVRDTCGNYSALSPYHNTIYISNNSNGTFTWASLYSIEGSPNPVTSYDLERDDNSDGNWHTVTSVAGTQNSVNDPDYNSYKNTGSWRVKTVWGITCTPTLRLGSSSAFNYSLSNVTPVRTVGIREAAKSGMPSIYPNPATNQLFIHTSSAIGRAAVTISVRNMLGELIREGSEKASPQPTPLGREYVVDISHIPAGIYFVQLTTEKERWVGKFVKE